MFLYIIENESVSNNGSNNDESASEAWYANLDIQVDRNSNRRIFDPDNYERDVNSRASLKSLIDYFNDAYKNRFGVGVCSTYFSDWNKFFLYLFTRFPERKC